MDLHLRSWLSSFQHDVGATGESIKGGEAQPSLQQPLLSLGVLCRVQRSPCALDPMRNVTMAPVMANAILNTHSMVTTAASIAVAAFSMSYSLQCKNTSSSDCHARNL